MAPVCPNAHQMANDNVKYQTFMIASLHIPKGLSFQLNTGSL